MKNFRSIDEFSKHNNERTVVTIGNFDGCHNGHKLLIEKVKKKAEELDAKPIALTFSPSPKEFFGVMDRYERIFTDELKLACFANSDIYSSINQSFDASFAKITAREFIENELLNKLNAIGLVVGDNFRFGHKAEGSSSSLKEYFSNKKEFSLSIIDHETTSSENIISSTLIRSLIKKGELQRSKELLGRSHLISATVIHGKKLGNTIGFPTANLSNIEQIIPKSGVYSGWLVLDEDFSFDNPLKNALKSVANIGINPTTDKSSDQKFEVHVLGRKDLKLYDKKVWFIFDRFIRDEQKFDSLDALISQIKKDCQTAEENLNLIG